MPGSRWEAWIRAADADRGKKMGLCWGWRRHGGRRRSAVLGDDFLEGLPENLPGENLDVFLDVPRFGVAKTHDNPEEVGALRLCLAHCQGVETFEVASDPVLFLNGKPSRSGHKLLKQVDGVDRRHIAFLLLGPPDTANAGAVRGTFADADRTERHLELTPVLRSLEQDDAPLVLPLFLIPVLRHAIQVAVDLESGFRREDGVGIITATATAQTGAGRGT